jgi:peroxiredoxin
VNGIARRAVAAGRSAGHVPPAGAGRPNRDQEIRLMPITVGDRLPDATFKVRTPDGLKDVTVKELTAGKKVVLFAVPGAFTPTCHAKHVPSFLAHLDAFKAKGVDTVACVAVNDAFVLDAWAKANGAEGKILFLADGNATFTKAIGLDFDGSGVGLGTRSKRYAMYVEDGVVKVLNVEDSPGVMDRSSAETLLAQI